MTWRMEDTIECYKLGFAPFCMDDGTYKILKLDEPDGVAEEHNFAPFSGTRFKTDVAALKYVKKKAAEGSDLCKRALELCNQ